MGYNKCGILLFSLALLAMAIRLSEGFEYHERDLESEDSLWDLYERWQIVYPSSRSLEEKQMRFSVFKENVKHVDEVNKMDKPYKLKVNKFADLTPYEFGKLYANSHISDYQMLDGDYQNETESFMYENVGDVHVPPSIDWRDLGAVTPVRNQGSCGCCWAIAAVQAIEGIYKIKKGKLLTLSEQQVVDCDTKNNGCKGGTVSKAYDYIIKRGGVTTEANYPYIGRKGKCEEARIRDPIVKIDGYKKVTPNEDKLLKSVAMQPVAVIVDADKWDMMLFSEGVFTGPCGTKVNHSVLVVGYGTTADGIKYWIVKNSWGSNWGDKGYVKMLRGVSAKEGLCGIAMFPRYPTIGRKMIYLQQE